MRLTVHDDHHQVGWVPVDLAVNDLARGRGDQTSERDEDTDEPLHGAGAQNESPAAVGISGEVTLVRHAGSLLPDGLIEAGHHDPGNAPARC